GCGTGDAIDIAPSRWRNAVGDARLRASQTTGLLRSHLLERNGYRIVAKNDRAIFSEIGEKVPTGLKLYGRRGFNRLTLLEIAYLDKLRHANASISSIV